MKPKTLGYLLLPALLAAGNAQAQVIKANNTTGLQSAGSWSGGSVPTNAQVAQIDSTLNAANSALLTTNNFGPGALKIVDPGANVALSINTGQLLTIGPGGTVGVTFTAIDMSTATRDLTINATGTGAVRLGGPSASVSVYSVAADRTLTINAPITKNANTRHNFQVEGTGAVILNGVAARTGSGFLGFQVNGGNLTLNNANAWFATSSERFSIESGTLNIGNDSALVNNNTATATPFRLNGGTIAAVGADRTITTTGTGTAHGFQVGGNFAVGGTQSLTLSGAGSVTNTGDFTITNSVSGGSKNFVVSSNVALSNDATNRTLTIAGAGETVISGAIANGGTSTASGLTKSGAGTLTLGNAANSFGGALTVNAGTLKLGAAGVVPDAAPVTLGGGTINLNGFNETFGSLTVSSASIIQFGSQQIAFADSSANTWTGNLSFSGTYVANSIRFGIAGSALTSAQLSNITVNDLGGWGLDADGYLVASAIPEASTFAAWSGLAGLALALARRRRVA